MLPRLHDVAHLIPKRSNVVIFRCLPDIQVRTYVHIMRPFQRQMLGQKVWYEALYLRYGVNMCCYSLLDDSAGTPALNAEGITGHVLLILTEVSLLFVWILSIVSFAVLTRGRQLHVNG